MVYKTIQKNIFEKNYKGDIKMGAKKIKAYECPDCGDLHETEEEAQNCCNMIEEVSAWKCTECDEIHSDKEDAKECCK